MQNKQNIFFDGMFNLPNSLSFIRLLLAVPIYFSLSLFNDYSSARYIVVSLVLLAFITDILDGYFARKTNKITEFGKIIDPLADKTLVILIILQLYLLGEIPGIYFWIIVLRDIIIFIGGIIISRKIGKVLPSNLLGKITVFSIGIYILIILFGLEPANVIHRFFFYISIILSFASVIAYTIRGYEALKWKNK